MSRYETYKPSEVVWIGDIPQQWKIKRLKDLVNPKITDGPHETPELVDDEDSIPFISAEAITENGINYEARGGNISVEQDRIYSLKCKPKRDDIFIVKSGSTTGRIGYVDTDLNFNIWSPLALVRSNSKNSSRFLFHFLSSDCIQRQIQNSWSFGTQPNIGMGVIERLRLAIPEYNEQITIANYLDDQTQKIDRLIANKKAQAEKLKELRQIEINNAVTKGLNPNAEMKDSGIEWLGKIPKHWEKRKIATNFQIIGSGTTPDAGNEEYYDETGKYYFVNTGDLKDCEIFDCEKKITEEAFTKFTSLKLFPVNTLLIAMYGATIGKVGILKTEATTNQACCALANSYRFNIDYMFYFFIGIREDIIRLSYGGGQPNISQDTIKQLRIPCPPKDEQLQIVEHLKKRTTALDQLIKNIEAQIEKLQELRKIKIYEAVTGKIKVNAYAETTA